MKTLTLFTTLGCHLCEEAEQLMNPVLASKGYRLKKVEISESEELVNLYGIRIPVIQRLVLDTDGSESLMEMGWPFGAEQLHEFLIDQE